MKYSQLLFAFICNLAAAAAHAQAPVLRVEPGAGIAGSVHAGVACFPVQALEAAGAAVTEAGGRLRAQLGTDSIVLQATSPYVRAGGSLQQLASPVALVNGALCIPEQFFVQLLPRTYPQQLSWRDGALRVANAAPRRRPAKPSPRVVVIDPGHGGVDPGRIGPNGVAEKDVVLRISRRLAEELEERGFEVHLTRDRDTLIALADRPRLANRWKGERPMALFLSIHANAAPGRAQGFETFFLSDARTEDERRVAEMENASVEYEETKGSHGSDFEQLLNTLRNDFYVRASNDLAEVVQQSMATFHPGPNRGVKRAGFRVLVGAIMPAVLVEVAFISDREEARRLAGAEFQQQLADGIADAVQKFFAQNEHLWAEAGGR